MSKFVHLHTHTHYSLLDGMSKIPDLVAKAKELGMTAVAMTDHGNLYGAVEFYKECTKAGIKPILGVEAYIAPGDHKDKTNSGANTDRYYHLILLVKNETGWKNLLQLVTDSWIEGFYYKPRMDKKMLRERHEGLIATSACLGGELSQLILAGALDRAEALIREYQDIFGAENFYIEIGRHPKIPDIEKVNPHLIALAKKTGAPLVATGDSHYLNAEDKEVHDILLAIQTGKSVNDPKKFTLTDDFSFMSAEDMAKLFPDLPEALANSVKIAEACDFKLELGKILLPRFDTPDGSTSASYLRKLVAERTPERYPVMNETIQKRIEYELGVIEKMGFPDYFLIVQDFINWAKDRGVVVGPGRGSAAGSIISYILKITDLDPIHYDLLFERFLNPERIQMPDIDVDITDVRRDEVFGYLTEKYGADRVAHIITFGTMAARASIRDVGRSLDIELAFCDRLAKLIPFNKDLEEALDEVDELKQLYKTDERAKKIINAAKRLEGVARHASVHACGTVIAAEPLPRRVPLQHAPQDENVTLTQFEMHAIEDLGLLKMDILGLKNLTIIEDTIRLVADIRDEKIDLSNLPLDDKEAFKLFQRADTVGVFQLESGGMRRYLKELKPTNLEDIIAMVALYRPGPMELIPSYINRKYGKEIVTYLHPKMEAIMGNTFGIGIYQEQMMRIASDMAGYTLAEADTLRKAIGKKIKKLLDEQEVKLIAGLIKNGIPEKTARAIWDLFPPFARYGFNRSHAACYAMIAYRTAYLKAHYPTEFMTALLNADSGDVERISFLIGECKKMNVEVLPPDINKSAQKFAPEGNNIRFGLDAIKNVGSNIVAAIIESRERGGEFPSLAELLSRVQHKDLNKKSLESLTKCGALDSFGIERNTILQNLDEITKFAQAARKAAPAAQSGGLFGSSFVSTAAPRALQLAPAAPATKKDKLAWEKELLGLYVSDHPLTVANENGAVSALKPTRIKDMLTEKSAIKSYRICGMVASVKSIITKTGKPMCFAKVEDQSGAVEVVVFSDVFAKNQTCWKDGAVIVCVGKLNFRNGETSLLCDQVKEIA
jgi:DNA polymerase-3 subunit alpha